MWDMKDGKERDLLSTLEGLKALLTVKLSLVQVSSCISFALCFLLDSMDQGRRSPSTGPF